MHDIPSTHGSEGSEAVKMQKIGILYAADAKHDEDPRGVSSVCSIFGTGVAFPLRNPDGPRGSNGQFGSDFVDLHGKIVAQNR